MSTSGVLRWGILSTANIGIKKVIPGIQKADRCEALALASRDGAVAKAAAERLGIHRAYGSYEELLADPEVDAIYIPLPNHLHAEWTIAAARAGKHVLCEKPMAISVADTDAMIDAARRAGVALSLHHNYLSFPENQAAQQVIRDGRLGRVVYTCINCLGLPYFGGTWRLQQPEVSGGGILLDMLHLIYLTNAFHGGLPTSVDARVARIREEPIRVEDFATARLEYQGGIGEINVSWGQGWGGTQLMGTRGRLIYDYDHFTSVNYERPDRLRLITHDGETDIAFPPAPPFSVGPFRQFVAAVRDGRALDVTGEDGRAAVEVALAGYESAALHTAVAIPLAPSDPVYQHGIAGLAQLAGASRDVVDLYRLAP